MMYLHEPLLLLAQRKIWCVFALVLARRRLDHTGALVAGGGDTGERIGFLVLGDGRLVFVRSRRR